MGSVLAYWLKWPSVETFIFNHTWAWPLAEIVHFFGITLLVGIVGMFDLRLLGVGRALPVAPFRRLLPWGVLGFILCVVTGTMFVTGIYANTTMDPYDVLLRDRWLQLKLLFIALAGLNLLAFYITGVSRRVDALGAGDDAPLAAKVIAGTSLFLWLGVVYFGRLIPWGL